MAQPLLGFLAFALGTVVVLTVPVLAVWLLVQLVRGLGYVVGGGARGLAAIVRHLGRFVRGEVVDSLHFAGSVLTATLIAPLAIANLGIGRLRAAKHYGAAFEDELTSAFISLYRIALGHPVHLVGLSALTDGLERRLPDLVAREPKTARVQAEAARPARRRATEPPTFEGYTLSEELRAGGSGARLFRASPTSERAEALRARGIDVPSEVVIKAFDIGYGSTMPQIVRESRSLEAAKRLGLIVEHEIDDDAFHYVMPFVPGRDLDVLTRELHAKSGASGLDGASLGEVLGVTRDLCTQLDRFHREGLWHKDIKPSNLLVSEGRLHVVDFGLATPLESALTLTTHGTEFFRDPELVRLALQGKRVKDVDGVKFDLYSAGAVLYSMIENSFPAHGSLSSISKRSPEALRWIVRRAMADVDKRYANAEDMARDLDVLLLARDPYAVRPADLPSVRGDAPSPRPSAATAASFPNRAMDPDPDPDPEDHDVKRFRAFGSTVAVHGLGRLSSHGSGASIRPSRAERKRHKAEARAEKSRARVAANAGAAAGPASNGDSSGASTERSNRRSRRRGMMRAVAVLAIFVGIVGGTLTLEGDAQGRRLSTYESQVRHELQRARFAAESQAPEDAALAGLIPSSEGRALSPSIESRLSQLGYRARVLILTDPGETDLSGEAFLAGEALRELGAVALGVPREPGQQVANDDLDLLGQARYQIDLAGASLEEASARLARFAGGRSEIDAVLWLQRDRRSGNLRSVFVRDPMGVDAAEDGCSAACDVDASAGCVDDEACRGVTVSISPVGRDGGIRARVSQ